MRLVFISMYNRSPVACKYADEKKGNVAACWVDKFSNMR